MFSRKDLNPDLDSLWAKDFSPAQFPRNLNLLYEKFDNARRFWILDSGTQAGCVIINSVAGTTLFFKEGLPINLHISPNSITKEDFERFNWLTCEDSSLLGYITLELKGKENLNDITDVLSVLNSKDMCLGWGGHRETRTLVFLILTKMFDPFQESRDQIVPLNMEKVALELVARTP